MTLEDPWLAATWPFVADHLPRPPATVLEIGCGTKGGFVPALHDAGYAAVGVDPNAPQARGYVQAEFEGYPVKHPVEAIVACTSLHRVAGLDTVLDRVAAALAPGGTLVVVEWARERFDEATARWCFERLAPPAPDGHPGWLRELHTGRQILRSLTARFDTRLSAETAYFFADLHEVTEAAEQAAVTAGLIRATGIRYVGRAGSR